MPLAERDQIVQTFAADSADRAFANTVRLRRSNGRLEDMRTQTPDRIVETAREFGVPVADQESVPVISRDGLPELLKCPVPRRMSGDVEVKNPARRVLNHDEDAENLESRRNYREKVAGDDR